MRLESGAHCLPWKPQIVGQRSNCVFDKKTFDENFNQRKDNMTCQSLTFGASIPRFPVSTDSTDSTNALRSAQIMFQIPSFLEVSTDYETSFTHSFQKKKSCESFCIVSLRIEDS